MESQQYYCERVNPAEIGSRTVECMALGVDNLLRIQEDMALSFVEQHPTLQPPRSFFINLYFEDLITNPIGHMIVLYEALEMSTLTAAVEKSIWDLLQDPQEHKNFSFRAEKRDLIYFGVTREAAKSRFKKYYQYYFDEAQKLRRKQEYKIARAIRSNSLDTGKIYDDHGSIVIEGRSWLETTGLASPLINMEVLLSYARTRFVFSDT